MPRINLARTAIILALIAAVTVVLGQSGMPSPGKAYTVEDISFRTFAEPEDPDEEQLRIPARLYLPKPARSPLSAVIIVPSSSGVEDEREIYYAQRLARVGIAALVVDSFTPRGLTDSLYDQSALEVWDVVNDAVAGLSWLSSDKRFNRHRIAIMGVSKGGSVARDAAISVQWKWLKIPNLRFAAHIAISPDCVWTNRSNRTTGAPILFMLAEFDNQTPAQDCLDQAARFKDAGNRNVRIKLYKGAQHAWEELGPAPDHDDKAENYSQCRVWIEDNGSMHSAETGELVPEDDWHSWAKQNCMTLGTRCCGGTPPLKEQAMRDLIAFLREYGFR
ncbi:MAG: dienelactone hydrolase family protein [Hyphomicrobiaceae bacterium]